MNDTHEVISAFLDDEAFDASELGEALGQPGGRELLIDLIALRHLAQPERHGARTTGPSERRSALRVVAGIAAVLVALVGGYMAGERGRQAELADPPAATRVVEASSTWQTVTEGMR